MNENLYKNAAEVIIHKFEKLHNLHQSNFSSALFISNSIFQHNVISIPVTEFVQRIVGERCKIHINDYILKANLRWCLTQEKFCQVIARFICDSTSTLF